MSNINDFFSHGATWVTADFHLHTIADKDFNDRYKKFKKNHADFISDYLARLKQKGIKVGIITNHNLFDEKDFRDLRKKSKQDGIFLLPGLELNINAGKSGIHTLIVFHPDWIEKENCIERFLSSVFPEKPKRDHNNRASTDFNRTLQALDKFNKDYFIILAHVESDNGFFKELDGGMIQQLVENNEAFSQRVLGLQRVKSKEAIEKKWPKSVPLPAFVEGSDEEFWNNDSSQRSCWIKLGDFSYEAVKFALCEHQLRVRCEMYNQTPSVKLSSISFEGGKLGGKSFNFSSAITNLIGSRGSGKSAVIECIRYVLGIEAQIDSKYKEGLAKNYILESGGKVTLEGIDTHNRKVRIERGADYRPEVYVDGKYKDIEPKVALPKVLYFGQKDLIQRTDNFDDYLIKQLLQEDSSDCGNEEAQALRNLEIQAKHLKELEEAKDKAKEYSDEIKDIEFQLGVYEEKGIDKKLELLTLFDKDQKALESLSEKVDLFKKDANMLLGENLDFLEAFPSFTCPENKKFIPSLDAIKLLFDESKNSLQKAHNKITEAQTGVFSLKNNLVERSRELRNEFNKLQQSINEPGLDISVFRKKKVRLDQLRKLCKAILDKSSTLDETKRNLKEAATHLHGIWRKHFQNREEKLKAVTKDLPKGLSVETLFKDNNEAFELFLKRQLKGSNFRTDSYRKVKEKFKDGFDLYERMNEIDNVLSETDTPKLKQALKESLFDFLSWRKPDTTIIKFEDRPLANYSLGQQASYVLLILMSLKHYPVVIIDQPEDDLDNETLYNTIIKKLLEKKGEVQFIFATHNPNIPVLGDCEQVYTCMKNEKGFHFTNGSIDKKEIQKKVIKIMEGGKEAFEKRQNIYRRWTS